MGGSSRVSGLVQELAGRQEGRGAEPKKGNGSNLGIYSFCSGRTEARDPESWGRGPSRVVGSASRHHKGCGEWMHFGAGLRPRAPKVLTEPVTPAQEDPCPLRPGHWGRSRLHPAKPSLSRFRLRSTHKGVEQEEGEAGV